MYNKIFSVAYAQIDWHDFVVVETVDYQPFEIGNFPPPTTPEEVGARILIQERLEDGEDIEMQLESDEEEPPQQVRKTGKFVFFWVTDCFNLQDEGLSQMEDRTRGKKSGKDDNRVQDMEEGSSEDEGEDSSSTAQPSLQPPLPPVPDKVLVKKYDPKHGMYTDFSFNHKKYLIVYFLLRFTRSITTCYRLLCSVFM